MDAPVVTKSNFSCTSFIVQIVNDQARKCVKSKIRES
jgi:hypothetical protein